MNMAPKVRPLWKRIPIMGGLAGLMAYKFLKLPTSILPRDLKAVVKNWDYEMFTTLLKSGVTSAIIDQPCYFKMPEKIEPKAQVAPEYQFSQAQLEGFYRDGFIGPIDAFSPEEMTDFKTTAGDRKERIARPTASSRRAIGTSKCRGCGTT